MTSTLDGVMLLIAVTPVITQYNTCSNLTEPPLEVARKSGAFESRCSP